MYLYSTSVTGKFLTEKLVFERLSAKRSKNRFRRPALYKEREKVLPRNSTDIQRSGRLRTLEGA